MHIRSLFMVVLGSSALQALSPIPIPRLTILIVIDGLAADSFSLLEPHFNGAFRVLIDEGVVYNEAHHPHGAPNTATGHATIGTGAYASSHGIVGNNWINEHGQEVESDEDPSPEAAVFSPDGFYEQGRSARNLRVDTLADQIMLQQFPYSPIKVFSFSTKSRAAILLAGRLGLPFWLDQQTGHYTTSKRYASEIPAWLKAFTQESGADHLETFVWNLQRDSNNPAYSFAQKKPHSYAARKESLINTIRTIDRAAEKPFNEWCYTPHANKSVLDCAQACLEANPPSAAAPVVLMISLSSLDKIQHVYGPNSLEAVDTLLQLDTQIGDFLTAIEPLCPHEDRLVVLTSDHGFSPIPEAIEEQGIDFAKRISCHEIRDSMNALIKNKFGIDNAVVDCKMPYFYLDHHLMRDTPPQLIKKMTYTLEQFLKKNQSFQQVWTFNDLQRASFASTDIRALLKNQLFSGRSGHIVYLLQPYCLVDSYENGTTHTAPYNYDTHVPLILHQPGRYEHAMIEKYVWSTQIAPTIAHTLHVPRPSAARDPILPGIAKMEKKYITRLRAAASKNGARAPWLQPRLDEAMPTEPAPAPQMSTAMHAMKHGDDALFHTLPVPRSLIC